MVLLPVVVVETLEQEATALHVFCVRAGMQHTCGYGMLAGPVRPLAAPRPSFPFCVRSPCSHHGTRVQLPEGCSFSGLARWKR